MRFTVGALLLAALMFCSCAGRLGTGVRLDDHLTRWVPPDTTLLAGADVQLLKASDFYKRHQAELNLPELDQLTRQTGVDLRRDLNTLLLPWNNGEPLLLAHGHFDAKVIKPHLLSAGAKPEHYQAQEIFSSGEQSLFFPADNVLAAGAASEIHALLNQKQLGVPEALLKRIAQLPKTDQLWAVSSQGIVLDKMAIRGDIQSALANLTGYVTSYQAGLTFDAGAKVHVDLWCTSPDDAKQIHDAIRGAIGFARLSARDDQLPLLKLYDAIQVSNDREEVHVRADLSSAAADQLVVLLSGLSRRGELLPASSWAARSRRL